MSLQGGWSYRLLFEQVRRFSRKTLGVDLQPLRLPCPFVSASTSSPSRSIASASRAPPQRGLVVSRLLLHLSDQAVSALSEAPPVYQAPGTRRGSKPAHCRPSGTLLGEQPATPRVTTRHILRGGGSARPHVHPRPILSSLCDAGHISAPLGASVSCLGNEVCSLNCPQMLARVRPWNQCREYSGEQDRQVLTSRAHVLMEGAGTELLNK